jgi:hypothetical protein
VTFSHVRVFADDLAIVDTVCSSETSVGQCSQWKGCHSLWPVVKFICATVSFECIGCMVTQNTRRMNHVKIGGENSVKVVFILFLQSCSFCIITVASMFIYQQLSL